MDKRKKTQEATEDTPKRGRRRAETAEAPRARRGCTIRVENLVKRYGSNYALSDVSFEIEEGEIVGLLGPNGAGKSTTMNILTGYLTATSGAAEVGGVSIVEDPMSAKRLIGYLPELPPVYGDMTVDEYLNFVYELKHCTLPREAHLDEVRDVVKLREVRRRLIRNLSKGYRQRVGIAQALIGDPPVIIFDEPTVGLDPKQILEVRNLLRTLGRRHTVILSTHILAEVQAVCDRIIIINRGQIVANERTDELARVIDENSRYRYAVAGPQREVLAALRSVKGVLNAEATQDKDGDAYIYAVETAGSEVRRYIFRTLAEKNYPIFSIENAGGDLESIFMRLVDRDAAEADTASSARRNQKERA